MTEDSRFTNREITTFLQDLRDSQGRIEAHITDITDRVSELELSESSRKGAEGVAVKVAVVFVSVLIGYLAWVGVQIQQINGSLDMHII